MGPSCPLLLLLFMVTVISFFILHHKNIKEKGSLSEPGTNVLPVCTLILMGKIVSVCEHLGS